MTALRRAARRTSTASSIKTRPTGQIRAKYAATKLVATAAVTASGAGLVAASATRRAIVCKAADADTLGKVRSIISEQLGADLDKVGADAKFVDLGADSLDTVEIMMALEEQFDITLDEEGAEKISTVQEAADMIADQVAAK